MRSIITAIAAALAVIAIMATPAAADVCLGPCPSADQPKMGPIPLAPPRAPAQPVLV